MIDTQIFNFKKMLSFYVVSTSAAIADLSSYIYLHNETHTIILSCFMERIMSHKAYCYVLSKSLPYLPISAGFNWKLKKAGRLTSVDGYAEAFYLAHPETALETLPFPLEDIVNDVVENTPWVTIFNVDKREVIRRLRACSDHVNRPPLA